MMDETTAGFKTAIAENQGKLFSTINESNCYEATLRLIRRNSYEVEECHSSSLSCKTANTNGFT